ncbi:hypothetical protein ACWCXL_28825 [Streptomyces sp. NPDC001588]
MTDLTARWKAEPPTERLLYRHSLLNLAGLLEDVAVSISVTLARRLAISRARKLARQMVDDLTRERDYVFAPEDESALDLACWSALRLAENLEQSSPEDSAGHIFELDRALELALSLAFEEDESHYPGVLDGQEFIRFQRERLRNLSRNATQNPQLRPIPNFAGILALATILDLQFVGHLASVRDVVFDPRNNAERLLAGQFRLEPPPGESPPPAVARDLGRDFLVARENLLQAANDFRGADLTMVKPVTLTHVDLDGISWDRNTQWPTHAWAAHMTRMSVEHPPGSGVFIVQPHRGRHRSGVDSLMPI